MFQIEFQLTNLGQESYFAISSEERYINPGQVNFPDTSLTHGLSERKAFVRKDETHPLIISIHVPSDARIGTTKEITIEVQPYVNTNTGNNLNVDNVLRITRIKSKIFLK